MRRSTNHRPLWKILPAYFVVTALLISSFVCFAIYFINVYYCDEEGRQLIKQTQSAALFLTELLENNQVYPYERFLKKISHTSGVRYTLIDNDGLIVFDTCDDQRMTETMTPELSNASLNRHSVYQRYSRFDRGDALFAGVQMKTSNQTYILRGSIPIKSIIDRNRSIFYPLVYAGIAIQFISAIIFFIVFKFFTSPLNAFIDGIARYRNRNFKHRLNLQSAPTEFSHVTEIINSMASQLDEQSNDLRSEVYEKETILTSLFDGILVIDNSETIINYNHISANILGLDAEFKGKKITEVIRNTLLTELIRESIATNCPTTREIIFRRHADEFYQVDCIPIKGAFSIRKLVIVFHNLTQTKRIQSNRRDIILHVCKLIKKPISHIQAQLTSGEGIPDHNELGQETSLLLSTVNDLIYLTELEDSSENQRIELGSLSIRPIVDSTVSILSEIALAKSVNINVKGENFIYGNLHAIEQMLIRLLHNAINYSLPNGKINIHLEQLDGLAIITITDDGIGIPKHSIEHVFKPFYRINTPEHRVIKGGGLGLAIAKTIVDYHNGSIAVTSEFGSGASFKIVFKAIETGDHHVTST
ncbi:hypothetical protein EB093_02400 [bacterium]|nr:hypothetical protein [bacterium]